MIFLKGIALWLIFIIAESVNGSIRMFWLVPSFGDVRAHQISFVTGSILVLAIATLFIRWLHISRIFHLIQIGLLWLFLTVGFEIALGRFVLNYSWQQIAADYNVLQGGLMPFGLILLMLSPIMAAKLRGVFPPGNQPHPGEN